MFGLHCDGQPCDLSPKPKPYAEELKQLRDENAKLKRELQLRDAQIAGIQPTVAEGIAWGKIERLEEQREHLRAWAKKTIEEDLSVCRAEGIGSPRDPIKVLLAGCRQHTLKKVLAFLDCVDHNPVAVVDSDPPIERCSTCGK